MTKRIEITVEAAEKDARGRPDSFLLRRNSSVSREFNGPGSRALVENRGFIVRFPNRRCSTKKEEA